MLSKEEIETCKQELKNYIEFKESVGDNAGWARGLRYYIEKLEKAKKRYYEGYIDRNNEIVEICKICKYRDKYRQLEAELSKANKIIDEMAVQVYITKEQREEMKEYIWTSNKPKDFKSFVKQYFKKKVEGEKLC